MLLAAGLSTRMGEPKALLPWMGTSLVGYQLEQLRASRVEGVVVVLGHEAEAVMSRVAGRMGVKVVVNRGYERGRASSVVAGVGAVPTEATGILILNVDQPRPAWLIDEVVRWDTLQGMRRRSLYRCTGVGGGIRRFWTGA